MNSRGIAILAPFLVFVGACAAPSGGAGPAGNQPAAPAAPKRIVAAIKTVPPFLYSKLNPSNVAGGPEVAGLVQIGLTGPDDQGGRIPQLAEAVPSTENGLWAVFPDGKMETTWKVKPNAQWHDGTPLTSADLAFTARVAQDRDLAILRDRNLDLTEAVETPDPATLRIRWKQPFIGADKMFSSGGTVPMPKHLLEKAYTDEKATFLDLPYWNVQYVGAGPFKVRELDRDTRLIVTANDQYVLGRPRVDEVEVRFITDDNTLIANLLAGAVDYLLGRGPSIEQALQVRDQWKDGTADFKALDTWIVIYPQLLNPTPAATLNPLFRQALLSAIDRQEMANTIQAGLVPIAHSVLPPNLAVAKEIESFIVKYEYEARRATQTLEQLGFNRGADGIARDAGGQPLRVQIQVTTALDVQPKSTYAVADYWQRVGVGVDVDIVPPQRAQDRQYRAEFPTFALQRQGAGEANLQNLHSSQARTAERDFSGSNNARYINPELDSLIDRYLTAIPLRERTQAIGQIIRHITERVVWMGLFFDTEPALFSNRLINAGARVAEGTQTWNAHLWDVKS